jgi:hypothetical protein
MTFNQTVPILAFSLVAAALASCSYNEDELRGSDGGGGEVAVGPKGLDASASTDANIVDGLASLDSGGGWDASLDATALDLADASATSHDTAGTDGSGAIDQQDFRADSADQHTNDSGAKDTRADTPADVSNQRDNGSPDTPWFGLSTVTGDGPPLAD